MKTDDIEMKNRVSEKWGAKHANKRVSGVKAVTNDVEVKIPDFSQRTDGDIAEVAVNALEWNTHVPADSVRVTVDDGWLTLEGEVEWQYRANLQAKIDSTALYETVATVESNPQLAGIYRRLGAIEEKHAQFWEQKLLEGGCLVPSRRPSWRARILGWLAKHFGPRFVLPMMVTMEQARQYAYGAQPKARVANLPSAGRSHASLLRAIIGTPGLGLERRRTRSA